MCCVSTLHVYVCMCEWNFSHVSLGSEGQTLQENQHIPQKTGTYLCIDLDVCICKHIKLASGPVFCQSTSQAQKFCTWILNISMLYMYGMSPQTDIQDTKAGRQHSGREVLWKRVKKGQRKLKREDKELSCAIWLWAFTNGNIWCHVLLS